MESTKKLANASWLVIVVYMFASRFVGLAIGPVVADLLALFLATAGLIVAIVCFVRMRAHGRKGILGPAVAGPASACAAASNSYAR